MAPLGPFGAGRRVVVGVSGGADSMALAVLLRRWGEPLAVVVDHGLRPESGSEAATTMRRLAAIGVSARLMRLDGLRAGPNLGARARAARYSVLLRACREIGQPDLFIAHHRQDQAETVLLRAAAGSGASGLAAMAGIIWRDDARILRPLLTVAPSRLRATLSAAGVAWVEDPTNTDASSARGRLRAIGVPDEAATAAGQAGRLRREADTDVADELGRQVALHPTGHAELGGALSEAAWSALIWTVSGRAYPPPRDGVRQLRARGTGTLHGVQAGRGLVVREAATVARPMPARAGAVWDGRFVIGRVPPGATIGAVGAAASRLRGRAGLPSVVVQTLPAFRFFTDLLVVPHVAYPDDETCFSVQVDFRPSRPLAGAPFWPAPCRADGQGMHMGAGHPMSFITPRRHGVSSVGEPSVEPDCTTPLGTTGIE